MQKNIKEELIKIYKTLFAIDPKFLEKDFKIHNMNRYIKAKSKAAAALYKKKKVYLLVHGLNMLNIFIYV